MTSSSPALDPRVIAVGAVSAATRFVPVPFVDDIIKRRGEKYVVGRAIERAGFGYAAEDIAPLFEDADSSWTSLPRKLITKGLLFPVRRVAKIVMAVDGVPRDALRPALLARAVDHAFSQGLMAPDASTAARRDDAEAVRRAFEDAFEGVSGRLRSAAWADVRRAASSGDPTELGDDVLQLAADFDERLEAALKRANSRG